MCCSMPTSRRLYSGLPRDPAISPLVVLLEGRCQAGGHSGPGLGVLGASFHYVTKGPNEVSEEIEKEFKDEK